MSTYSQGMRQRLALAGALMRRPRLLLLDEPTNGLDPGGIKDFRSIVRSVADEGMTVVLSSHLLTEVEQVCDRVVVLGKGRMLADAATASFSTTAATGWRSRRKSWTRPGVRWPASPSRTLARAR